MDARKRNVGLEQIVGIPTPDPETRYSISIIHVIFAPKFSARAALGPMPITVGMQPIFTYPGRQIPESPKERRVVNEWSGTIQLDVNFFSQWFQYLTTP